MQNARFGLIAVVVATLFWICLLSEFGVELMLFGLPSLRREQHNPSTDIETVVGV
jgi:hypothetical protein